MVVRGFQISVRVRVIFLYIFLTYVLMSLSDNLMPAVNCILLTLSFLLAGRGRDKGIFSANACRLL